MRYWRVDDPDDVRSSDVITGPPINPCPVLNIFPEQRRRRRRRSLVAGAADDLWPFSTIRAGVLVLNHGSAGKLSDTIDFETPEGGATIDFTAIHSTTTEVYILCWRDLSRRRLLLAVSPAAGHLTTPR